MEKILHERLKKARAALAERGLDGLLLYGRENTRYLSGFSGSTSFALITGEEAILYVDSRYTSQAELECPCMEKKSDEALPARLCADVLDRGLKKLAYEDEAVSCALRDKLAARLPGLAFTGFSDALSGLRRIKDAAELALIRRAVEIADEALALTLPHIKAGVRESEVAARLEYNMKSLGADKPSFDSVVASGWRSALPHGVASEKRLEHGDALVMDFGALYKGYCSDMTRSFFIGAAPPKLAEVYAVVLRAQLEAEAVLKAGCVGADIHQIAVDVIAAAGYGEYFGHGLGHSLGLEIHEEPRCSKAAREVLPAGCLMTVEPGIYLPGLGGIRIEDCVLVREEGIEILTRSPKELQVL